MRFGVILDDEWVPPVLSPDGSGALQDNGALTAKLTAYSGLICTLRHLMGPPVTPLTPAPN